MKRLLLVTVVLGLFLWGSIAFASYTRVTTMGNVNLFVKDYANKDLFPHVVAHYPNQAMLESSIGLGVDEGGVLLDMGNTGVWGFFVERKIAAAIRAVHITIRIVKTAISKITVSISRTEL